MNIQDITNKLTYWNTRDALVDSKRKDVIDIYNYLGDKRLGTLDHPIPKKIAIEVVTTHNSNTDAIIEALQKISGQQINN